MRKHTYRPIEEAPKDGTPVIGVCGGVESAVAYEALRIIGYTPEGGE